MKFTDTCYCDGHEHKQLLTGLHKFRQDHSVYSYDRREVIPCLQQAFFVMQDNEDKLPRTQ